MFALGRLFFPPRLALIWRDLRCDIPVLCAQQHFFRVGDRSYARSQVSHPGAETGIFLDIVEHTDDVSVAGEIFLHLHEEVFA